MLISISTSLEYLTGFLIICHDIYLCLAGIGNVHLGTDVTDTADHVLDVLCHCLCCRIVPLLLILRP